MDTIWAKKEAKDFDDIGDIPITLIATVMQHEKPELIFHTDEGRKQWGEIQCDWVKTFPRGEFVATRKRGHYLQKEEPELVLKELSKLISRLSGPE